MRIIGGEARGRPIQVPKGSRIRPTSDRVKESLFDILQSITGTTFLDLFAGCGNVGLEALSRGARRAVFVEKSPRLAAAIRANAETLGFQTKTEVINADAENGLRSLGQRGERFDILFADPPYEEGLLGDKGNWLAGADLLDENGVMVLQHSVREKPDELQLMKLIVIDQRRYGDTLLTFLERKET